MVAGRPTKLTQEMHDKIVENVKKVFVLRHVAGLSEINVDSIYEWLNRAKEDRKSGIETIYTKFSDALKKAQAEAVQFLVGEICIRPNNWQANAWILERCFRKDFSSNAAEIEFRERLDAIEKGIKVEAK